MIDKILTGIFTKFTGSTLATAVSNRMYSRYVNTPTFPYIVVTLPSIEYDCTFSDDLEEVEVQFMIVSQNSGETEVTDILNKLITLYDECTLTITGYTHVYMWRERILSMSDAANNIRQIAVIYSIMIEK